MPVQPMLLHRMALVSFRLFCKNLGNLQEFFGQMVYRPPWPKIARTPMYKIVDLMGEVTEVSFYEQELQKEGPIFGGAYLRREICVSKSIELPF